MTEFEVNDPLVQQIWDRLRTLVGAKVFKIKNKEDLEKIAKKYKTLSGYERSGLIKRSNITSIITEKKMQTFVAGYKDKRGVEHKGHYRQVTIRWTKKETIKLQTYVSNGRTVNQISHYLGRNPSSIKLKIRRIKKRE